MVFIANSDSRISVDFHPQCLVIGEIACKKMLVVLNKVDLLQPEKKQQQIDKVCRHDTEAMQCVNPLDLIFWGEGGGGAEGFILEDKSPSCCLSQIHFNGLSNCVFEHFFQSLLK